MCNQSLKVFVILNHVKKKKKTLAIFQARCKHALSLAEIAKH